MKKKSAIRLTLILLAAFLLAILPSGFNDPNQELYYNQYTNIHFISGELFSECFTGRECYTFPEIDGEWFQISIPPRDDFAYVLGHRYTFKPDNNEWVILDTNIDLSLLSHIDFIPTPPDDSSQAEKSRVSFLNMEIYKENIKRREQIEQKIIFRGTKEEALEHWRKNGWPEVPIVEFDDVRKQFPQTMRSRFFQIAFIAGLLKMIGILIWERYWFIVLPITGLVLSFFLLMQKCRKVKK